MFQYIYMANQECSREDLCHLQKHRPVQESQKTNKQTEEQADTIPETGLRRVCLYLKLNIYSQSNCC